MEANRRRFMEETLERIVDLALQLPQLCPQPLPLLRKQVQLTSWLCVGIIRRLANKTGYRPRL